MAMQPPLDDPRSAKQPQAVDSEDDVFGLMVAGLREHIFGKGAEGISKAVRDADDPGRVIGEITYALVKEAAKQVDERGLELTYDIVMGVATEVIDDITELMAAQGVEVTDKQREYALLYAQQLHVQSSDPSEDERNAAKQSLKNMKQGGQVDKAVSYVQQRGMESGVDPFGVRQMDGKMMGKS